MTKWYDVAKGELGTREGAGENDNPRVISYLGSVPHAGATHDSTPWCMGFVNWCLDQAGHPTTQSLMARSALGYGKRCKPQRGCIIILKRGEPPSGHVGFYDHEQDGRVFVLGGNQGDCVSIVSFPKSEVLDYRMPSDTVKVDRKILGTAAAGTGAVVSNVPLIPAPPDLSQFAAWQSAGEQASGLLTWAAGKPLLTAGLILWVAVMALWNRLPGLARAS